MNREFDSKKPKMQTPRRPIGLSRISPRTKLTPPIARPSDQVAGSKTVDETDASKHIEDDSDLVTPTKRRKLGRFVLRSKQSDDAADSGEKVESPAKVKTIDDLKTGIKQMQTHLEKYESYKVKTKELNDLIEVWSNAGRSALQMLQDEIKPEQETEQILTHLHLPVDVFDFKVDEK